MKLTLILLAAGDSRRFDGNKLLTPFHGKAMYQYIVEEVAKLPDDLFDKKIVVTQYREIMEDLGKRGYLVVENVRRRRRLRKLRIASQSVTSHI